MAQSDLDYQKMWPDDVDGRAWTCQRYYDEEVIPWTFRLALLMPKTGLRIRSSTISKAGISLIEKKQV